MADPENFGGGGFEAQNLKNSDVFTKIESDFSAEIGNSNVFFAQIQVVSKKKKKKKKKKKVFTKIETDFSPDSLRLGWWGGMHPEMEPNYSKQRLIFRPKLLLLGWWGGCIPPIPPLNPPLLGAPPPDTPPLRISDYAPGCAFERRSPLEFGKKSVPFLAKTFFWSSLNLLN